MEERVAVCKYCGRSFAVSKDRRCCPKDGGILVDTGIPLCVWEQMSEDEKRRIRKATVSSAATEYPKKIQKNEAKRQVALIAVIIGLICVVSFFYINNKEAGGLMDIVPFPNDSSLVIGAWMPDPSKSDSLDSFTEESFVLEEGGKGSCDSFDISWDMDDKNSLRISFPFFGSHSYKYKVNRDSMKLITSDGNVIYCSRIPVPTYEEAKQFLYERYNGEDMSADEGKAIDNGYAFPISFKREYADISGDIRIMYRFDTTLDSYELYEDRDDLSYDYNFSGTLYASRGEGFCKSDKTCF